MLQAQHSASQQFAQGQVQTQRVGEAAEWNGVWQAKGQTTPKTFMIEFRIPWKTITEAGLKRSARLPGGLARTLSRHAAASCSLADRPLGVRYDGLERVSPQRLATELPTWGVLRTSASRRRGMYPSFHCRGICPPGEGARLSKASHGATSTHD